MDNNGTKPKEKRATRSDSGGLIDRTNIDYKRGRPKETRDTRNVRDGLRESQSMVYNEARSIEKKDDMRASNEYRERQTTDNNGARPKETMDSISGSGGQNIDCQLPSPSDMCPFFSHLSVRLCDVLDKIGASAEFRKLRQNCALSEEILLTLTSHIEPPSETWFRFGSSSEGTTTPGMNSDSDFVLCHNQIPVVDNISDAGYGRSFLMISDKHTKPGYVKLQHLFNGQPQTIYKRDIIDRETEESDGEGRICMKHLSVKGKPCIVLVDERSGPADTSTAANKDFVQSFYCSKLPKFTSKWIEQKRSYRWPSKRMLDQMATMGCFVVGVGHPASRERDIEWRLSFSLQERELMFSMNLVQHKCYILLKLIKKDLIEPVIGKTISSYHLKTCMLYVIQNTKAKLWKRSYLVQCVFLCLNVLLKWMLEGNCPNYFIKEENMFDRDILRKQRKNIVQHLKYLLSNGCEFIFHIKLDGISDLLKNVPKSFQMEYTVCKAYLSIKLAVVSGAITYKSILCCVINDSKNSIETLHANHTYLSQTKCIKDHKEQQTQKAFAYVIPYVHLQLAQSYASLAFSKDDLDVLHSYNYHLNLGRYCDMTSSRLLEVTILYKLEQYEQCIDILDQVEQDLNQNSLLICRCDNRHLLNVGDNHVTNLNNLTAASILRRSSTCLIFLRSDLAIIPMGLQYEMYRSVGTTHLSRHIDLDRWMNLTVVDAGLYLHLIKYLVYANRNQLIQKHLAINKLEFILKHDPYIRHRETGYNLLGWIHVREGMIQQGIHYFRRSWSIRQRHNAAKFHVMFFMFGDMNFQM